METGPLLRETIKLGNPVYYLRNLPLFTLFATDYQVTLGLFESNGKRTGNQVWNRGASQNHLQFHALEDVEIEEITTLVKESLVSGNQA